MQQAGSYYQIEKNILEAYKNSQLILEIKAILLLQNNV